MSIIIRPHRPYYVTYVGAVYCYRPRSVVCRSICWFVTLVSPAKTVESIDMMFGVRTRVDPGNHVLDGAKGPDPHGKGQFWGIEAAHSKVQGHCAVTCAKTAEPIVMSFGLWAQNGPRNHELDRVQIPYE